MVIFKTYRKRTLKIESENWLKRNTKSVLIAFLNKTKKNPRYDKVKYFTVLTYNCNNDFILQDLNG